MKKRLGVLALAATLLTGLGAAAPAAAAENTPPAIHVPTEATGWLNGPQLGIPWREYITATDAEDGDISDKLVKVEEEWGENAFISDRPGDPDGTQYFTVSVTDSAGATTTARFYHYMVDIYEARPDNKPPVLIAGGEDKTVCLGETYDPHDLLRFDDDYDGKNLPLRGGDGFTLEDDSWFPKDLEYHRTVFGSFDEPGTVLYSYSVSDSQWGHLGFNIYVNVRDCSAPSPKHGFFLNDSWGPTANWVYTYGGGYEDVYVGDWDGDGSDTITLRIGNTFLINNGHDEIFDYTVTYGRPGDTVLVGDWDGDGVDTFAVRRGREYHVKNTIAGGKADQVIHYGREGDAVLVGDWNSDGKDTFAVRRGREYHVKNTIAGGKADQVVAYGRPGDDVYVGDWDGDGKDTFTVRRGSTYYVANAIRGGKADRELTYGRPSDVTLVGDWNRDGVDTLGVRR